MTEFLSAQALVAEFAAVPTLLREILNELRTLNRRPETPREVPAVPSMSAAPRELLTPAEAADLLRVDPQTLSVWRLTGHHHDLPFVKMGTGGKGGRVYYRRSDLEAFISRHLFRNTTQAGIELQEAKEAYWDEVSKRPSRRGRRGGQQ